MYMYMCALYFVIFVPQTFCFAAVIAFAAAVTIITSLDASNYIKYGIFKRQGYDRAHRR